MFVLKSNLPLKEKPIFYIYRQGFHFESINAFRPHLPPYFTSGLTLLLIFFPRSLNIATEIGDTLKMFNIRVKLLTYKNMESIPLIHPHPPQFSYSKSRCE